jgi:succinate dehydrogenase / fumarate reductase, cytochrome b subunit
VAKLKPAAYSLDVGTHFEKEFNPMADAMELKRETTGETLLGSVMKFMSSSVGSKVVMAITGLGLWLFLVGHLAGNLLAYVGRDAFNHYAMTLKGNALLLWGARLALLIGFPLHIVTAIRTVQLNRAARPTPYAHEPKSPARVAAKSMMLSGAIVLVYFVYHIAHFTWHATGPQPTVLADGSWDAYTMLVMGFQQWPIALFYIVAQVLLAAHLSHGIYSLFQHLGLWGAKWTPFLKNAALVIGYGLCAGFASIPVAVMLGFIKP